MTDGGTKTRGDVLRDIRETIEGAANLRARLEALALTEPAATTAAQLIDVGRQVREVAGLLRKTNTRIDAIIETVEAQQEALITAGKVLEAQQNVLDEMRAEMDRLRAAVRNVGALPDVEEDTTLN